MPLQRMIRLDGWPDMSWWGAARARSAVALCAE
jgi:hypothetical protein